LRRLAALVLLPFALLSASCRGDAERERLGLFTTLPIYWAEAHDIAGMLHEEQQRHWVRDLIEQRYAITPLDSLAGGRSLSGFDKLLLAQPRALSPQENVALDEWVRRGGRVLLFADPLLTAHSRFPLGDKRRPQEVALLSPLLTHWGLSFRFDEAQPAVQRTVSLLGEEAPVEMAGQLGSLPGGSCAFLAEGLAADCAIGKGRVLVVADAALLDGEVQNGEATLAALLARAFDR
jgi:hypothetical protein